MLNINSKLERGESLNDDDDFYLKKYTKNICNKEYFKEYSGIPNIEVELTKMFDTKIVTMETKLNTHIDKIDKRINEKIKDLISKYEIEMDLLNLTDFEFNKELENINKIKLEVDKILENVEDMFSVKLIFILEEFSEKTKNTIKVLKDDININGTFNKSELSTVLNNFEINIKSKLSDFQTQCDDIINYYEIFRNIKNIYINANNYLDAFSDYIQKDIINNLAEKLTEGFNNYLDTLIERVNKKFILNELRDILKNCFFHVNSNEIHEIRNKLQSISDDLQGVLSKHENSNYLKELFKDNKIKNIMFNKIDESKTELEISQNNKEENLELIKNKIDLLNNLLGD